MTYDGTIMDYTEFKVLEHNNISNRLSISLYDSMRSLGCTVEVSITGLKESGLNVSLPFS